MKDWLKSIGASVSVAFVAFLAAWAALAAARNKRIAEKWRDKAVETEIGEVKTGTNTAKAAISQAKLHEAKAAELKKKAEQRITQVGQKDEEMADLLDRWRRS